MRKDCPVCRGVGTIRLPLYQTGEVGFYPEIARATAVAMSKTFPCPECAETIDLAHIVPFTAECTADEHYTKMPDFRNYMLRQLAQTLASAVAAGDYVRVTSTLDDTGQRRTWRGAIGVVIKGAVQTIVERERAAAITFADDVRAKTIERIRNWASNRAGRDGPIQKDDAIRILTETLAAASRAQP